ncbi:uncharacterized protein Z520_09274 [Fonsecaea multimorphosa CBS 102226]|uniref:Integral membrane protein n=1 Tax=Fonsecaea multimorphosa CBS 102226 TaxID=1442371 RepID=A0A0D2JWU6_9EURO|nr:uncharacterized protein Z520_09274 [Fonsecaea multimorphosa CBS 102226]KIX94964.1 hypothetical protein Z520_09274 [Fonsecaea multimorphosa CBS 102226]OAL20615.1 hypothetical protein AYO22_08624 [Fonsecaea multimorphosa]
MSSPATDSASPTPSPFNYILSFLLVGICWGFTTPFIRKAAVNYAAPSHPSITDPNRSWISRQIAKAFFTVVGLLKTPTYALPLLLNLTGSVWFFLLVGQAELSLTVPITNSLAFLFTVLGEWYAEGKLISRDTWLGMILGFNFGLRSPGI